MVIYLRRYAVEPDYRIFQIRRLDMIIENMQAANRIPKGSRNPEYQKRRALL